MNHTAHSDDLPVIQDSYSLAISDYLGADMSCSPSVQADLNNLQVGIDLHGAEVYAWLVNRNPVLQIKFFFC